MTICISLRVQPDNLYVRNRIICVIIYATRNDDSKTKVYYFVYKFLKFVFILTGLPT